MADAQIENIRHADNFLSILKDKDHRDQLAQKTPELANAIAQYEKDELDTLSNENLRPEIKQKMLDSMQGIYAYHIRQHGPEYYGPKAKNEKLATIFTEALKPTQRDQGESSEQDKITRDKLIKDNPLLNKPLQMYQHLESQLGKDGKLNADDVNILNQALENIGTQIRANRFETFNQSSRSQAQPATLLASSEAAYEM